MIMRTKEEIDTELVRLAECRIFIPNFHKHSLDAQWKFLEGRLSNNDIFDKWGEEALGEDFDQQQLDAVIEAANGSCESDEAPNVNWQELKNS
ncbi:hypothetical protein Phage2-1_00054 [Achromobacter phage 2-1]|nr:hypothetical protein Phage2-1_00054 [Achromobacter phage 2-1]